jgi:general secretion pathway protein J
LRPLADSQSGFTLLELLVGLALLALAAAMTATGLGGANRVWDRTSQRQKATQAVAAAASVLRLRLEQAEPASLFGGTAILVDFSGTAETIRFLAPPSASFGTGALRRDTVSLAADGSLLLSSTADAQRRRPLPVRTEVLLRGVQSLSIAYFGAGPPDGQPRWRDNWRMRQTLPALIRVRVRFPPGDPRWWPDLIVAPRATIDSRCVQNASTGRCRGR